MGDRDRRRVGAGAADVERAICRRADADRRRRATACRRRRPARARPNAKPANLNFTLKDVDGKDVTLASLKGKVIAARLLGDVVRPVQDRDSVVHRVPEQVRQGGFRSSASRSTTRIDKLKPYVAEMKMNYPVLQGLDHDDVQDAYGPISAFRSRS